MRPETIFMHRLCLQLGFWPHPDFLYNVLTSKQISDWIEYSKIEPFGFPLKYFQLGQVATIMASWTKNKKPDAFLPKVFDPNKKPQSDEDIAKIIRSMAKRGIKKSELRKKK